jgi:uncharacterized protein (TIGR00369 family)
MIYSPEDLARINDNPLYRTIGIEVLACADGNAVSTMSPLPEVCWPTAGQPHGGILFTQIDTTTAFAALSTAEAGSGCATVDSGIQYAAPARHAPFRCEATTLRRTGRTVFVRAEISDARGEIVALCQATFRILSRD